MELKNNMRVRLIDPSCIIGEPEFAAPIAGTLGTVATKSKDNNPNDPAGAWVRFDGFGSYWFLVCPPGLGPVAAPAPAKKYGYIVCTPRNVKPFLEWLGNAYPDLPWPSGRRPQDACTVDVEQDSPVVLSLDKPCPQYCWPFDPNCHPELTQNNLRFATDLESCKTLAREVYGAPAKSAMWIDIGWLARNGACIAGVAWFKRTFGAGAKVLRTVVRNAAVADGKSDYADWLDDRP